MQLLLSFIWLEKSVFCRSSYNKDRILEVLSLGILGALGCLIIGFGEGEDLFGFSPG